MTVFPRDLPLSNFLSARAHGLLLSARSQPVVCSTSWHHHSLTHWHTVTVAQPDEAQRLAHSLTFTDSPSLHTHRLEAVQHCTVQQFSSESLALAGSTKGFAASGSGPPGRQCGTPGQLALLLAVVPCHTASGSGSASATLPVAVAVATGSLPVRPAMAATAGLSQGGAGLRRRYLVTHMVSGCMPGEASVRTVPSAVDLCSWKRQSRRGHLARLH